MTKIKYDYSDVEDKDLDFEDYEGPQPKAGVYTFKVQKITTGKSQRGNNPMVTVIATCEDKDYKGWPGWIYLVQTEDSIWKTKSFTDGIGLTKPGDKKGTWDTDDAIGKTFRAKIKFETYTPDGGDPERRAKIGRILPKQSESGGEKSSDKKGGKGKKKKGKDDGDPF